MEQLKLSAIAFQEQIKPLLEKYDPANVWNTDQTGFKYELVSTRTLSHKGERTTLVSVNSPKNKVTHSYTVQYTIGLDGSVFNKVFVCLQVILT